MDVPFKVNLQYLIGCPPNLVNTGIFEFNSFAKHNLGSIQVFAGYFHYMYLGTVPYSPVHVGIPTSFNSVFQFERKFFDITQTKRNQ